MRVDGKAIADSILKQLTAKVTKLREKGVIPHMAVILVGEDPASVAYVRQKETKAAQIGAKTTIIKFPTTISQAKLLQTIKDLNNDKTIHGIIVQRPLPNYIDNKAVDLATDAKKDIDAFRKDAPYDMPLAAAVIKILEKVYEETDSFNPFTAWLKSKQVVVIGKGETGGGPVITKLQKLGMQPNVIDSKTQQPEKLTESADIIISTVGNKHANLPKTLKNNVIMIIVGMYRGDDGKLHGDYETHIVEHIASFYTPVPGGVGPVNVAMLLSNLVDAAMLTSYS